MLILIRDLLVDIEKYVPWLPPVWFSLGGAWILFGILLLVWKMTFGRKVTRKLDPLLRTSLEQRREFGWNQMPPQLERFTLYANLLVKPEDNSDLAKHLKTSTREILGPFFYGFTYLCGVFDLWTFRAFAGLMISALALANLNFLRRLGVFRFSGDYFPFLMEQISSVWFAHPLRFFEFLFVSAFVAWMAITLLLSRTFYLRFQTFMEALKDDRTEYKPVRIPPGARAFGRTMHLCIFLAFPRIYDKTLRAKRIRLSEEQEDSLPHSAWFVLYTLFTWTLPVVFLVYFYCAYTNQL